MKRNYVVIISFFMKFQTMNSFDILCAVICRKMHKLLKSLTELQNYVWSQSVFYETWSSFFIKNFTFSGNLKRNWSQACPGWCPFIVFFMVWLGDNQLSFAPIALHNISKNTGAGLWNLTANEETIRLSSFMNLNIFLTIIRALPNP